MNNSPRRIHYTHLNVWKKATEFSAFVSRVTESTAFSRSPELRSQLYRSALSVVSNIAEGEGQGSNRGTIKFYFIARGSLYEARTQLFESVNRKCISQIHHDQLSLLADDVARLIAGVIRTRRAREP